MTPAGDQTEIGDLPCIEFVELVTDYLEDALPPGQRDAIAHHLTICPGCSTVLEQWQEVIRLTGRLDEREVDRIDPEIRRELLAAFLQPHPPPPPAPPPPPPNLQR